MFANESKNNDNEVKIGGSDFMNQSFNVTPILWGMLILCKSLGFTFSAK